MRKRHPWVWVLAAAGCVALAPAARAQVFVGPAVPNYAFGGFGGFFPGAYGSSWSNGFSRYGPPVPTYGIVPGAFGGADQRLNNIEISNGALLGLGRSGAGGGGPRRRHYYDGSHGGAGLPNQQTVGQAAIEVRVPAADADVYFAGVNTRQQ